MNTTTEQKTNPRQVRFARDIDNKVNEYASKHTEGNVSMAIRKLVERGLREETA